MVDPTRVDDPKTIGNLNVGMLMMWTSRCPIFRQIRVCNFRISCTNPDDDDDDDDDDGGGGGGGGSGGGGGGDDRDYDADDYHGNCCWQCLCWRRHGGSFALETTAGLGGRTRDLGCSNKTLKKTFRFKHANQPSLWQPSCYPIQTQRCDAKILIQERSRKIAEELQGRGKNCTGPSKETKTCSLEELQTFWTTCVLESWREWSEIIQLSVRLTPPTIVKLPEIQQGSVARPSLEPLAQYSNSQ